MPPYVLKAYLHSPSLYTALPSLSLASTLFRCSNFALRESQTRYNSQEKLKKRNSEVHAVVTMAAPPMKSQPLHNFSLPHLKWAHKNNASAASTSHSPKNRFRRRDSADQHRRGQSEPESDPDNPPADLREKTPRNDAVAAAAAAEENGEAKPWKLRPRKEAVRAAPSSKKETSAANIDGKNYCNNNASKSQRLRGMAEGGQQNGGVERKAKRKVWISLSKEEIEEDVYALTGGKPARRPKKWPKNVQKQLDNVFPGLYLVGVAADSYRIAMS